MQISTARYTFVYPYLIAAQTKFFENLIVTNAFAAVVLAKNRFVDPLFYVIA